MLCTHVYRIFLCTLYIISFFSARGWRYRISMITSNLWKGSFQTSHLNINLDADMKDWFMQRKSLRGIFFKQPKTASWSKLPTEFRQWDGTDANAMKDWKAVIYVNSDQNPGWLHSGNLTWNGKSTIWRCISYSRWGFSIAMFVYRRVGYVGKLLQGTLWTNQQNVPRFLFPLLMWMKWL